MDKRKIFTALGVGIILITMLAACGNSTPKTIDQFIKNYNSHIKETIASRVGKNEEGYGRFVNICTINNNAAGSGMIMAGLCDDNVVFMAQENKMAYQVQFSFKNEVPAYTLFSIIEAATLAAGDDYKEVFKKMGILKGNSYNIRNPHEEEIEFGGNQYLLTHVEGGTAFVIVIFK